MIASPSAASTTAPASTDGLPDAAFRVAAPVLIAPTGPAAALPQTPCRPADVTARAATRQVADGVDGVIEMDGRGCSLHVSLGPTALLGADGKRLAVRLDSDRVTVNPGGDPRWDIPLAEGRALWGFSWRGSWCGTAPKAVLVPMTDEADVSPSAGPYGDLRVPLSGPVPPCSGSSDSVLQPGVPGGFGGGWELNSTPDAVQVPPPDWSGLRAAITVPPTDGPGRPTTWTLRLTNVTGSPIALSPCPEYGFAVTSVRTGGSEDEAGPGGSLPCAQQPAVIAAHSSAVYALPSQALGAAALKTPPAGAVVTVEVAIADVPTATATMPAP
jgi:hypothetical protein